MRIAVAFILLISLAVAFKLEKEHPMFEDDPDERYGPAEQDEPFELDELDEPTERIEQENYEDGNEVESLYGRIFPQNYCCTHICIITPPDCFGRRGWPWK